MRDYIGQLIADDALLNALDIDENSMYSGDVDSPAERPYLVLRWGATNPGVSVSNRRFLTVWVHHNPGFENTIDAIHQRVRALLTGVEAQVTDTGWITAVEWTGESDDLSDDSNNTITRQSNFMLVGSGV